MSKCIAPIAAASARLLPRLCVHCRTSTKSRRWTIVLYCTPHNKAVPHTAAEQTTDQLTKLHAVHLVIYPGPGFAGVTKAGNSPRGVLPAPAPPDAAATSAAGGENTVAMMDGESTTLPPRARATLPTRDAPLPNEPAADGACPSDDIFLDTRADVAATVAPAADARLDTARRSCDPAPHRHASSGHRAPPSTRAPSRASPPRPPPRPCTSRRGTYGANSRETATDQRARRTRPAASRRRAYASVHARACDHGTAAPRCP